ncbi:MAG: phosphate signaling complex protein PhoU [Myxococcales bacterium]|jgi:phosphate transport system protein
MPGGHIDREFDAELDELRRRLIVMGGRVEEMIARSVQALVERDVDEARRIIAEDEKVDADELECDDLCLMVLVRRQPMGSDLRFITLALKMVTDLERIGDLAVNIAERAIDLASEPPLKPWRDVPRMAEVVQSMVHDAIDAFVRRDPALAEALIERDDEVDSVYSSVVHELVELMAKDPDTIERAIHVLSVAKWLERMADHATNLAEHVIFLERGTDVRHGGRQATG